MQQITEGNYYYFSKPIFAAGIIKRHKGKDMVLRHMKFAEGQLIAVKEHGMEFECMFGNTKYLFFLGQHEHVALLHTKPPQE